MNYYDQLCKPSTLNDAWKSLNKKKHSQGLDNVTIQDFKDDLTNQLDLLGDQLKAGTYKPVLLKPHLLKKPESGHRLLKIPAVRDRVVQKAITNLISEPLNKKYKIENNGVSYAYVSKGGVDKAALQIREFYRAGNKFVYKADIEKFFDRVPKKKLLAKIEAALTPDTSLMPLIEEFLNADMANNKYLEAKDPKLFHPTPLLGIAQGSALSPLFANVYLAEFDQKMISEGLNMIRYADDLVVLTKTDADAENAHILVSSELKGLELKVHALKKRNALPGTGQSKPKYSEVRRYQDLQFLGLTFKSDHIYPTGRSYQNAVASVRNAAYDRSQPLVKKLKNIESRIEGWCSAYSFVEHEGSKLAHNDTELNKVLGIMLKKHGLKVRLGISPHKALGLNNYSGTLARIAVEKAKKEKKAKAKAEAEAKTITKTQSDAQTS